MINNRYGLLFSFEEQLLLTESGCHEFASGNTQQSTGVSVCLGLPVFNDLTNMVAITIRKKMILIW